MSPLHRALFLTPAATLLLSSAAFAEDAWEVSVTPYVWLAGIDGEVGGRPGVPPVEVRAGFDDVFDQLSGYFMGKVEVRRGRFGAVADFDYLDITGAHEAHIGNTLAANADVSVDTKDATLAGYYRAHDGASYTVDVFAGVRYTSVAFELSGDVGSVQFAGEQDEDWWDPVFGLRGRWQSEGKWGVTGYADYGGFSVSSDAVWQVYGAVDYSFTDAIALSVGYRHYAVDFADTDGLDYKVALGGPVFGLRFAL